MTSSPPSSGLSPAVPSESPTSLAGNRRQGLRSLRDLNQHFTARADDSHAAPVHRPQAARTFRCDSSGCQALVRFLAYRRIKPHAPPLVRAPVNSFEFHPCGHTPQAVHLMRSLRYRGLPPATWCTSFTVRTTRVSKPVCSPHLRASASVGRQMPAFAIGVLPDIYRFHPYTWNSGIPSSTQAQQFPPHDRVEHDHLTADLPSRLRALYAQ